MVDKILKVEGSTQQNFSHDHKILYLATSLLMVYESTTMYSAIALATRSRHEIVLRTASYTSWTILGSLDTFSA